MGQLIQYRRAKTPGVIYQRLALFREPETVELLRTAFGTIKPRLPFIIDAIALWVLVKPIAILPDHLH
ncbi:hypothetical protein [Coleofasciculus sp. H7-2]|uniref:hypothetical protein n=1 Tax=Coleofasciculus sp. H7-2 TaxID=3351545 RepID=UPI00366BE88B